MMWKDIVCFGVIVVGTILFLYGSNYFDSTIGWTGVYLMVAGCFGEIVLRIYDFVTRKRFDQKS